MKNIIIGTAGHVDHGKTRLIKALSGIDTDRLEEAATFDLSNGGRGIGNQVESLVINPLSRWLFDHEITDNAKIVIEAFETAANPPSIRCRVEGGDGE